MKFLKIIKKIFLYSILFFNISCFGLFDSGEDLIIGKFYTVWIDEYSNRTIGFKNSETSSVTVIPEYIFSVGHNSNYIIAKQHPKPERFSSTVNTKITNCYIIDVKNSDEFVQKIYGPFDENKFNRKLKELKTSDLEFNQNYPEDPVNSNVSY